MQFGSRSKGGNALRKNRNAALRKDPLIALDPIIGSGLSARDYPSVFLHNNFGISRHSCYDLSLPKDNYIRPA